MKIEIIGSFKSFENSEITNLIDSLAEIFSLPDKAIIEIVAATNDEIKDLNITHRKKDEVTDVLSFPIGETAGELSILGTIVIAENFSLKQGETVEELLKHGFLHLIGYDHEVDEERWLEAAKLIKHKMYNAKI